MLPHIAFIGRAGAGKTTAAEMLVKDHGYERLSFAAPLKVACGTTTDRGLLQHVGCAVRDLVPDFWVNLLIADLEARGGRPDPDEPYAFKLPRFVVDDARFGNEVARLRLEGFVIVRVVAPRNTRVLRLRANGKLQDEAQLEHVSETELDEFAHDYRIVNDGDPHRLAYCLADILDKEARKS